MNYSYEEVEALVQGYFDLCEYRHRLKILVRLCDVERVFRYLPAKEQHALWFHEMQGLPAETVGRTLGIHRSTVENRCRSGLERLHQLINGRGH